MEPNGSMFPSSTPDHGLGRGTAAPGPGQSDMLRQLDALGVAERLRASSVSAAGNVALSSVTPSLHSTMQPSTMGNFIVQSNPNIGPLFQQDEQRGKPVLLHMLNEIYVRRGTPLPPALTGISSPSWDPNHTLFKFELGSERGVLKIAGRDVDLFKFWQALFAGGLTQKVTRDGAWPQIAAQLGLPPNLEDGTSITPQLQPIVALFQPLERVLSSLVQSQMMRNPQQAPGHSPQAGGLVGSEGGVSSRGATPMTNGTPAASALTPSAGGASTPVPLSSEDSDSRKRKAEGDEDEESKRLKRNKLEETGGTPAPDSTSAREKSPVKEQSGPLFRRKIEYVPVIRTITTHGGRDLDAIEQEYQQLSAKRPMRRMEDFGIVDVEAMILQLRSRLKVEVTSAMGLLYHLAFLRSDQGNQGLQLSMCDDLADELLDILEETAFKNTPDSENPEDADMSSRLITNHDLTMLVYDEGTELFAGVNADASFGHIYPTHQPWELITMITTIFTSVASAEGNPVYLASHPRFLDIFTRICMLKPNKDRTQRPKPSSDALQIRHLLRIRKETMSLLGDIGRCVDLRTSPPRTTRRLYLLFAAALMDSKDCISPGSTTRPPHPAMNIALDTFCQITHPDQNRTIISKEVPWEMLWSQMLMLSRILPITDHDIQAFISDAWMSFVFKAALAIYSFAVLAPLPMRRKMKSSPALRTALSRFLCAGTAIRSPLNTMYRELPPEARVTVEEYWKRVGETLKVIDAEEDPLAPTAAAGGLIGYGIGGSYDQHLGAKPPARGTGMFGGARQELLWSVMSSSAALGDVQLFEEWDYLLRVDTSTVARV